MQFCYPLREFLAVDKCAAGAFGEVLGSEGKVAVGDDHGAGAVVIAHTTECIGDSATTDVVAVTISFGLDADLFLTFFGDEIDAIVTAAANHASFVAAGDQQVFEEFFKFTTSHGIDTMCSQCSEALRSSALGKKEKSPDNNEDQ